MTNLANQLYPFQPQPPRGIGHIEGGFVGLGHAMIWYPKEAENRYWSLTASKEEIAADMVAAIAPRECDEATYVVSVVLNGVYWWLVSPSGTYKEIVARAVSEGATHYRFDHEHGCPAHLTFFRVNDQGGVEARRATEYMDGRWGLELWDAWDDLYEDTAKIPAWAKPVAAACGEEAQE